MDLTPIKTPMRRQSTNSVSFLATLSASVQTPVPNLTSQLPNSPELDKVPVNLKLFGGRILDHTLEQLTTELEEMFEVFTHFDMHH